MSPIRVMLRELQWWPAGKTASPSFLCNVGLSLVELMLRLHATFAFQLHAHLLDSCIAHDIPSAANCNRLTSKDTSGKARAARNYIAQIFEIAGRSTDCRKQVRAKYKGGARGFAARRKKKDDGPARFQSTFALQTYAQHAIDGPLSRKKLPPLMYYTLLC